MPPGSVLLFSSKDYIHGNLEIKENNNRSCLIFASRQRLLNCSWV